MEAREQYIEKNGIIFELRAYNEDGDTIISYTGDSFDDASAYSQLADDAFDKIVATAEEGKDDAINDAWVKEQADRSY